MDDTQRSFIPSQLTGVILAGGNGTRLAPLTRIVNKHLLPVYNRPMIEYPLATLIEYGCTSVVIVTGGENIGDFAEYLGDGSRYGVQITYRVQTEANGVAGALKCTEGLTHGVFPVILGDNYLSTTPVPVEQPTIYTKAVKDPQRFGVYQDGRIVEKPAQPASNQAVIGFYVYNQDVYSLLDTLRASERGELEITDINNLYIQKGAQIASYEGEWSDMGTFDSLHSVATSIMLKSMV